MSAACTPTRTHFGRKLHEGLAVRSVAGVDSPDFAVVLSAGHGRSGEFNVFMSTAEARAMAAALVDAANHHDAETANGAQAVQS